jgi:hypothetical protein
MMFPFLVELVNHGAGSAFGLLDTTRTLRSLYRCRPVQPGFPDCRAKKYFAMWPALAPKATRGLTDAFSLMARVPTI